MVREWRQLHKTNFVVWTVRSRLAWSKVQGRVSQYSLPVHAIFMIKRKRNYTVDYSPIWRELQKQRNVFVSLKETKSSNEQYLVTN